MRYLYLSYILTSKLPVYGGTAKIQINQLKSIQKGDSANVYSFCIENHWGTHIDCPAHFFDNGLKIADYTAEAWFFKNPFVIELPLVENQLIYPHDIKHIPNDADLLLIKSGFCNYRETDKYTINNPGFTPETGKWLRKKYPHIKAVGFDFISLSPYQNREIGRLAHKAFLDPNEENSPIFLIEDMNLSYDLSGLKHVWVLPLRVEGLDSAPCTAVGIFE